MRSTNPESSLTSGLSFDADKRVANKVRSLEDQVRQLQNQLQALNTDKDSSKREDFRSKQALIDQKRDFDLQMDFQKNENARQKQTIEEQEREIEALRRALQALRAEYADRLQDKVGKTELTIALQELTRVEQNYNSLLVEYTKLRTQFLQLRNEFDVCDSQKVKAEREATDNLDRAIKAESDIAKLRLNNEGLQAQIKKLNDQLEADRNHFYQNQEKEDVKKKATETEMNLLKKKIKELEDELEGKHNDYERQLSNVNDLTSELNLKLNSQGQQYRSTEDYLEKANKRIDDLIKQLADLSKENFDLKDRIGPLENEKKKAEERIVLLENELSKLKEQLRSAQRSSGSTVQGYSSSDFWEKKYKDLLELHERVEKSLRENIEKLHGLEFRNKDLLENNDSLLRTISKLKIKFFSVMCEVNRLHLKTPDA